MRKSGHLLVDNRDVHVCEAKCKERLVPVDVNTLEVTKGMSYKCSQIHGSLSKAALNH